MWSRRKGLERDCQWQSPAPLLFRCMSAPKELERSEQGKSRPAHHMKMPPSRMAFSYGLSERGVNGTASGSPAPGVKKR